MTKKTRPLRMLSIRVTLDQKTENKKMGKNITRKWKQNKSGVAILTPDKIDLKTKAIKRDKAVIVLGIYSKKPKTLNWNYEVCLEKVQPLLTQWESFAWHWCNLAAKHSGLECACVNNDDFTVLVSGGGRCHWVVMCIGWPSHSEWLSE